MVQQKYERHVPNFCKHVNQIIRYHNEVELTISLRAFIWIKKITTNDKGDLGTLYLCPVNIYIYIYIYIYNNISKYYCNN
jgi:hypothetical protein